MPKVLTSMPTPAAKPVADKPPEPKPQPKLKTIPTSSQRVEVANKTPKPERKVHYPVISINGVEIPRANLRMTVAIAKDILGWETEAEYAQRLSKLPPEQGGGRELEAYVFKSPSDSEPSSNPDVQAKRARLAKAPEYHFITPAGDKVICWRNANNRPLDEGWVDRLAQDILTRNFLFNCETIIVSKTRLIESGQHRLIALIWASILWAGPNAEHWRTFWPEEPWIETLVACGADESPEVLMTLDNTKARSEADNFYTSDLIDWTTRSTAKKECARYLQACIDLLWRRTGAEGSGSFARYKTHAVSMDFVSKHPTILQCVRHIWEENSSEGRAISALGLSPGQCAAMLYLMGTCESDGDTYRHHPSTAERSEEQLDFGMMEKAKQFFSLLAASDPDVANGNREAQRMFAPVRKAFALIVDPETGAGGRMEERTAILAKAWAQFVQGHQIEDADLELRYEEEHDSVGNVTKRLLDECPTFGGIDVGIVKKAKTDRPAGTKAPTARETEESKAALKAARDAELAARVKQATATPKVAAATAAEQLKAKLAEQKAANPGKLLLWKLSAGNYAAWDTDAMVLASTLGVDVLDTVDPVRLNISKADAVDMLATIAINHPNCVVLSKATVPEGQPPKVLVEPISAYAPASTA